MDIKELLAALNLSEFIALDFETSGLSPEEDRIIEVAAIKFVDGEVTDRYVTLVNPGFAISSEITDITSITNQMLASAPPEEEIVEPFLDFLGEAPLVAHNIPFDSAFLNTLRVRHGRTEIEHRRYDTLQLSRAFLFFRPAHSLSAVSEYFGLSTDEAHRAEADTDNCGQIFLKLLQEVASYPLSTITKIVEIIKQSETANRALYIDLANELTRRGDLKSSLTTSEITKPANSNFYSHQGQHQHIDESPEEVFGDNGRLKAVMPQFETRSEQLDYSRFALQSLDENRIAVIEAGTGLGKTQAYLYPALIRAFNNEEAGPTVISCHTKHLQDQLFYKDLPMLAETLDLDLEAVMLKGRNNYICRTRLNWLISNATRQLSPVEIESLLPLIVWLEWTRTGDLSECTGFWSFRQHRIAAMIRSEPGFCTTPICAKHSGCFFGPLRRQAYGAQVIVVNHALLLSEVKNPGVLPPFSSVVIDEAHNLVGAAYSQLTLSLDQYSIDNIIQRIDLGASGTVRLKNRLTELTKLHPKLERLIAGLERDVKQVKAANRDFFSQYVDQVKKRFNPKAPYTEKKIIAALGEEFAIVSSEILLFTQMLEDLILSAQRLEKDLRKIDDNSNDYLDMIQVFEQARQQLQEYEETLVHLTGNQSEEWVYWQEGRFRKFGASAGELMLSLCAAPIDISQELVSRMFSVIDSGLLTSATLRIDDSFDYFLNRTGLDSVQLNNVVTREIASPFSYPDQVRYFQMGGNQNNSKDPKFIADLIHRCHHHYDNRMMVLFTSWAMLNGCYSALRQLPGGRDLPLFAQRSSVSRYSLIDGMRETPNGILLGTTSFWEGVDLPGELLEILVITKLPFDVPSEPLIKAYSEMLNRSGRNSFLEYAVPEAVIKFRQGFGRLIRSTTDEGIFIVLDERVLGKRYGQFFREAVPTPMTVFSNLDELLI